MKLIIISGRSGSGKSISLQVLEDLGYYCIDNLPIGLLPALVKEISQHHDAAAISIDARNLPADLNRFDSIIKELKKTSNRYEILYFDADDTTLLKRFSETRRKHPLTTETISLSEALQREKQLLQPISELADLRIDTSHLTRHQLSKIIREQVSQKASQTTTLLFQSFGYKFGVPTDADYVFDVRCLPNPYWQPKLSPFSGLDPEVIKFLVEQPQTQQMLHDIKQFLETWIPQFVAGNRNYLTIAIGCTGGQHRSVYIAEELARYFSQQRANVQIRHREMG